MTMRYTVDCRTTPSESNCSLTISGEREEVLRAATEHAASVHGHENTPELRAMVEQSLQEETVGA